MPRSALNSAEQSSAGAGPECTGSGGAAGKDKCHKKIRARRGEREANGPLHPSRAGTRAHQCHWQFTAAWEHLRHYGSWADGKRPARCGADAEQMQMLQGLDSTRLNSKRQIGREACAAAHAVHPRAYPCLASTTCIRMGRGRRDGGDANEALPAMQLPRS